MKVPTKEHYRRFGAADLLCVFRGLAILSPLGSISVFREARPNQFEKLRRTFHMAFKVGHV